MDAEVEDGVNGKGGNAWSWLAVEDGVVAVVFRSKVQRERALVRSRLLMQAKNPRLKPSKYIAL